MKSSPLSLEGELDVVRERRAKDATGRGNNHHSQGGKNELRCINHQGVPVALPERRLGPEQLEAS